jgi:hypothetical protein
MPQAVQTQVPLEAGFWRVETSQGTTQPPKEADLVGAAGGPQPRRRIYATPLSVK